MSRRCRTTIQKLAGTMIGNGAAVNDKGAVQVIEGMGDFPLEWPITEGTRDRSEIGRGFRLGDGGKKATSQL